MTGTVSALLTLLCLALLRMPLMYLLSLLLPEASQAPVVHMVASIAQSLVLFALPGLLLYQDGRTQTGRTRWQWMLAALLSALLARAALTPLNRWWAECLALETDPIPAAAGWWELLQVLAYAVVPAVAEELFFRGALLSRIQRCCGRPAAVGLTALFFALMHGNLAGLPGHLAIGLLLTLLAAASGSVAIPMAAHLCYNLTALYWLGMHWLVPVCAGLALAVLGAVLATRIPRSRERGMSRMELLLCGLILLVMAVQYLL